MTPIIIPTQTLAKLKLRAIKEKNPNINFYVEQYRAELKAKAEAEQKAVDDAALNSPTIQTPSDSTDSTDSNLQVQTEVSNGLAVTRVIAKVSPDQPELPSFHTLMKAEDISLNEEQQEAKRLVLTGQSVCIIGPAGTGKTSTVNSIIKGLIASQRIQKIGESTKVFRATDYAMIGCAYTRRARDNLARNSPPELATSTLHSLIEFAPTKAGTVDQAGNIRLQTMFEPQRNEHKPLPVTLQIIIIDESSMVSTELYKQVTDAIHPMANVQWIFLGDLAQLPPVFGHAILGFKLLELPVVELKKVYRQKDGEILDFATQVRQGIPFKHSVFSSPFFHNDRLTVYTSKQVESVERRTFLAGNKIQELIHTGQVNPEGGDFILCPFNKGFGNNELNNWAADYYDQRDNRRLYTIIAGYSKKHFAIGDKVLIDKRDCLILGIDPNPKYSGVVPPMPSHTINRWGVLRHGKYMDIANVAKDIEDDIDPEEYYNSHMTSVEDELEDQEKSSQQASHVITYQMVDTQDTGKISTTGDLNALELAYCISVHKSQGSQANTVVLFISRLHKRMQCRELLYTAATRAINKLMIFADPDSINKCIRTPVVKGDTLAEKAEYFKGKAIEMQNKERLAALNSGELEFDDI